MWIANAMAEGSKFVPDQKKATGLNVQKTAAADLIAYGGECYPFHCFILSRRMAT
jgi:hypothetical protein